MQSANIINVNTDDILNIFSIYLVSTTVVNMIDANFWFYVVAVVAGMLSKVAVLLTKSKRISVRAVFISLCLTIVGGLLGYVIGMEFYNNKPFIRFTIVFTSTFLGEVLLITISQLAPTTFKRIIHAFAKGVVKKLGADSEKDIEEDCDDALDIDKK